MKKFAMVMFFALALTGAVFAQSAPDGQKVPDTGALPSKLKGDFMADFSVSYVLNRFPGTRVESGRLIGARGYVKDVPLSNEEREVYGGLHNSSAIDSSAELLAMASVLGIQDVKKEDALNLYAEIAMEGAANQFLGVTGTTHSAVLERLRGKYGFTQTQIAGAIRATVAETVDAQIPKSSYGAPRPNVVTEIKQILTNFYLNPTQANFDVLAQKLRVYGLSDGDYGRTASTVLIDSLDGALGDVVIVATRSRR